MSIDENYANVGKAAEAQMRQAYANVEKVLQQLTTNERCAEETLCVSSMTYLRLSRSGQ